jgi:DNA-binding MarR family transcriptional regulator
VTNSPALTDIHEAVACLGRLSEVFRQRRLELAASVGLTEQQWSVLDEIEQEHFMPSLFARRRDSSAAAVSKILRQLLDKELVVVSLSSSDGRQRNYELSADGKRILERLREMRQHAISEVWLGFSGDELAAFTRFGNELIARLTRYSVEYARSAPTASKDYASPRARRGTGNGKVAVREGI